MGKNDFALETLGPRGPTGPLVRDVQSAARNTSGVQENCQAQKGQGQKDLDIISTQETDEVIDQVKLQVRIESENADRTLGEMGYGRGIKNILQRDDPGGMGRI